MRCKMIVKEELAKLNLHEALVDVGMVEILQNLTENQHIDLKVNLLMPGLEFLDDKKGILIEMIKNVIVDMIYCQEEVPNRNYSDYTNEKLKYDYMRLSSIFSKVKGITLQNFIIKHNIEIVKELLLYEELNLTEKSSKLHYCSVAHFSTQFKKAAGLSPYFFKQMKQKRMMNLQNL